MGRVPLDVERGVVSFGLSGAVSVIGEEAVDVRREDSFLVFLNPSVWIDQCSSLGVHGSRRDSRRVFT